MQPMEIIIQDYGLTHTELSQITGKHRTNISKMAGNARLMDNQMLSICWNILLKVRSMPEPARMISSEALPVVPSDWIEQEKLKQTIWQQKLTRLLNKLEKMQKQAGFWEVLCHCKQELVCTQEWLNRHREEKRALLQKCWEHEYLPLLLKLRQCEARIAAWEEAIQLQ